MNANSATFHRAARAHLLDAVRKVTEALKTVAYYERVIQKAVRELYGDKVDVGDFIDTMIGLVEGQLRRAWNEGARDMGYGPEDMTADDLDLIQERIDEEMEFILDFAEAVDSAGKEGAPIEPLQARADMWVNRYNEVVNFARAHFGGKQRLMWVADPAKDHCTDEDGPINCLALDGVVATAEDWAEARSRGIYPGSGELACHGFHCGCDLKPTNEPLTEGGIPF